MVDLISLRGLGRTGLQRKRHSGRATGLTARTRSRMKMGSGVAIDGSSIEGCDTDYEWEDVFSHCGRVGALPDHQGGKVFRPEI